MHIHQFLRIFITLIFISFTAGSTLSQNLLWKIVHDPNDQLEVSSVLEEMSLIEGSADQIFNFSYTLHPVWFSTVIQEEIEQNLFIENPTIGNIDFYIFKKGELIKEVKTGNYLPVSTRETNHPGFIFKIPPSEEKLTILLKVSSLDPLIVPISIQNKNTLENYLFKHEIIGLIVTGILISLIFLYLIIFLSLKDISYSLYLIYAFFILFTILRLNGYTSFWLWPEDPIFNRYPAIMQAIPSIAAALFAVYYLRIKKYFPYSYKFILVLIGLQFFVILLSLSGYKKAVLVSETIALIYIPSITIISGIILFKKKYSPAFYFLTSSVFLFIGSVTYVLINYNLIETTNIFFRNSIQIGIALEMAFLAIGISKRIESLRKDYFNVQKENLRILEEKEEQLQREVLEKTKDLALKNKKLRETIEELKSTQFQLVKAEKLASIGVLTAGIAHEINNPINYIQGGAKSIKSNIEEIISLDKLLGFSIEQISEYISKGLLTYDIISKILDKIHKQKLELDYDHLLSETYDLLDNIQIGANKTSEIVAGLQSISRIDDDIFYKGNLIKDLNTALSLVKQRTANISINTSFDKLPEIEYAPGKMTQVFLILLNNSIDAINYSGSISINASIIDEFHIKIIFNDNGEGIADEVKDKVFDPFFTTKSIGAGTGIGLSIAKSIIENHHGKISFDSILGRGTTFTIELPISQWEYQ